MRNSLSPFLAILLFLYACENDKPISADKSGLQDKPLSIIKAANPEWEYEKLRLYPVVATSSVVAEHASLKHLKTLSEGMKMPGFRMLERKQFGRGDEPWYHGLTVQNKTQDTILLLSGDVVKGGNQDRVIAHHEAIMPMSVRNIEVFCVEAGRSSYYDQGAPAAEKEAAAFKGYYNVASPMVRRAVQNSGNQQEVWDAVEKVTKANQAESPTKAYTALDSEGNSKARRDAYMNHLGGLWSARPDIVGVVAVCGDQVLGVDIFSHPDLFRRHYTALLHGYVTEAAVAQSGTALPEEKVEDAFEKVAKMAVPHAKGDQSSGKFSLGNTWVHLFAR